MTLDVCIETVFTDLPYRKRMERVASPGYRKVEFWHPEGTWDGVFGGCPTRSEDHETFLNQVRRMIAFCSEIDCRKGVIMTGSRSPISRLRRMGGIGVLVARRIGGVTAQTIVSLRGDRTGYLGKNRGRRKFDVEECRHNGQCNRRGIVSNHSQNTFFRGKGAGALRRR